MKNNEPFTEHNLILLGKAPRQVEYIGHNYNTYKYLNKFQSGSIFIVPNGDNEALHRETFLHIYTQYTFIAYSLNCIPHVQIIIYGIPQTVSIPSEFFKHVLLMFFSKMEKRFKNYLLKSVTVQ